MQRLLKAIVVEDDPTLCRLFAETLDRDPNIQTAQAHDLTEAVNLCRKEPQVVLLADLSIPGAPGVEVVPALRREAPGATLVVVTGRAELIEDAKRSGAHAAILKGSPESVGDELVRAVRNAVVAHDVELLFSPARAAVEKQGQAIKKVEDSVRATPKG